MVFNYGYIVTVLILLLFIGAGVVMYKKGYFEDAGSALRRRTEKAMAEDAKLPQWERMRKWEAPHYARNPGLVPPNYREVYA